MRFLVRESGNFWETRKALRMESFSACGTPAAASASFAAQTVVQVFVVNVTDSLVYHPYAV